MSFVQPSEGVATGDSEEVAMQDGHDVAETGCLLCRTPLASVATATAMELIPGRLAFLVCDSCASLLEMPPPLEPLPQH